MDYELVPRPSEACDWMLNSSHEQFGLHQAKNVREPTNIEVPKKAIFKPYSIHWHGPTAFPLGGATAVVCTKTDKGLWQKNAKNKLKIYFLFAL